MGNPAENPVCVYLGSEFVYMRLTLGLNSALVSIDGGKMTFILSQSSFLIFQWKIAAISFFLLINLISMVCPKSFPLTIIKAQEKIKRLSKYPQ